MKFSFDLKFRQTRLISSFIYFLFSVGLFSSNLSYFKNISFPFFSNLELHIFFKHFFRKLFLYIPNFFYSVVINDFFWVVLLTCFRIYSTYFMTLVVYSRVAAYDIQQTYIVFLFKIFIIYCLYFYFEETIFFHFGLDSCLRINN